MNYRPDRPKKRRLGHITKLIVGLVIVIILGVVTVRYLYDHSLGPVSDDQQSQLIQIPKGATVNQIATLLQQKGLIRSSWAFQLYLSSHGLRQALEAGAYDLSANENVEEIVSQLTHGKIATNLVLIPPGRRVDQIRSSLIKDGFSASDVNAALNPATYAGNPALVGKPAGASLEGYIYPDSYGRTSATTAKTIITDALAQMNKELTPNLQAGFARQGLSTYQAVTLASIVEQEVPSQSDRDQVAQVFIARLRNNMPLQSDSTGNYATALAGLSPSVSYQSPYNSYLHTGLPPTPIGNVSLSALTAVAHPANTNWFYFVSGDDGITYYATTLAQHQAQVQQYCKQLCGY